MPHSGSRSGDAAGDRLLNGLHTECGQGNEYSTSRPVVIEDQLYVVYTVWCGDCGAAAWETVPP